MKWPRLIGVALALCLHGGVLYALLPHSGANAFDDGSGSDNFTVAAEVSLESYDRLRQNEQTPEIDRTPIRAVPRAASEKQQLKIEPAEKAQTETPLPQQTVKATPSPAEVTPEAPPGEPPLERKSVTQTAAVAAKAQIEQHAAAALAMRRDEAGHRYMAEFSIALERNKVRPHAAKQGDVLLQITIAPSGQLLEHAIIQSSGAPELDRAAITALQRGAPFPPLPPELSFSPLTFTLPFQFRVR
jgi:protein TonB